METQFYSLTFFVFFINQYKTKTAFEKKMKYKTRLDLELDDWLDSSLGCGIDFSRKTPDTIQSFEFTNSNPVFRYTSATCPYESVQLSACKRQIIFKPATGALHIFEYENTCPTPERSYSS